MHRIRVCVASPSFFPTYGGAQLRFLRYFPGLHARDIDVSVLTGTPTVKQVSQDKLNGFRNDSQSLGTLLPEERINGTAVSRICLPRHKSWRRWFIFNQKVVEHCGVNGAGETGADVVQFLTNLRPRALPWVLRLRKLGVPTVYAVTLAPPFQKYSRLKVEGFKLLFNSLSAIVTNSSAIKQMLEDIGVRTEIEVIPNGVNLERFRPVSDQQEKLDIRARLGIPPEATVVTSVGAVSPRKGSDLLVKAWAELVQNHPDLHLLMVGPRKDLDHPGLGPFRRRIEKTIRDSGKPDQVHFAGFCDNIEDYYRAADIFVLPSEREGMPNSMLEAMASSIPVIITPFSGLAADLGKKGQHYLLAERSVDDLKRHIDRLITDPERRKELGRNGLVWVTQNMDLASSLDKYADMYKRLAEAQVNLPGLSASDRGKSEPASGWNRSIGD